MFTTVLGSTAGKDSVLLLGGGAAGDCCGEAAVSVFDSGLALEAASLRTTMLFQQQQQQ
jgi:hypothetical protein